MSASPRELAADLIKATCADQASRHLDRYEAVRPQKVAIHWVPGERLELDCSDYARFICYGAGIPDPAGNGYASYGNSSSIWAHCHHISLTDAQPGDIVTFGYRYGEKHACQLYEFDAARKQWRVGNFGRPGQPVITWLAQEIAYHQGMTVTVCQVAAPEPPVSPIEVLRSETDFYAWISWRHGWNAWKHYGARNPHVRPNVGRVIAKSHPGWWLREKRFLLNRSKGNKVV